MDGHRRASAARMSGLFARFVWLGALLSIARCGLFVDRQSYSLVPPRLDASGRTPDASPPPFDADLGAPDAVSVTCSPMCAFGALCSENGDCSSLSCNAGKCTAPTCAPGCLEGSACGASTDCASGVCTLGTCTASDCTPLCPDKAPCGGNTDCASGICTDGKCVAPACSPTCADGAECGGNGDCASGGCNAGRCVSPTCAPSCADGASCGDNTDCGSGICTDDTCQAPSCAPSCATGASCGADVDCSSGLCTAGICTPASNCAALHVANPSLATGIYQIRPKTTGDAGAPIMAYCDMATSGGGWTEVLDQDVTVMPGYWPTSEWLAGVNGESPNSGQYSILQLLPVLKSAASYELRIEWPTPPNDGSVEWTQVESPLTAPAAPTISDVQESPPNQIGCGSFRGLAPNVDGKPAALEGDATPTCYYWAIGTAGQYGVGIPSYSEAQDGGSGGTPHARLWVR